MSETSNGQAGRGFGAAHGYAARVSYKTRGNSGRSWDVIFDLRSDAANNDAAVDYAWKHNANITASARWVSSTHQTANAGPVRHNDQAHL